MDKIKDTIIARLDNVKNESLKYYNDIVSDINGYKTKESTDILVFLSEYLHSDERHYFTISSKDTFNDFENTVEGYTFVYSPLNDHSRPFMHKGDVVFCYRQGQFSNLEEALNVRGIYAIGVCLADPKEIYRKEEGHNRWGVAITIPVVINKHLELRNIQLNPITINLTPYNGNRNDSLQYIDKSEHHNTLLELVCARNKSIHKQLEVLLKKSIRNIELPDEVWNNANNNSNPSQNLLSLQQIFYGAPGTGKSYQIDKYTNEDNRIRTTFHPDYDYAAFVGCYKPSSERRNMLNGHGYSVEQLLDRFFESKDESKYKGSIKARYLYESLVNCEDIRRHGLNASDIASRLTAMGFDKTAYTTEASCMYNIYEWLKSDGYIMDSKITYKFVPQSFTKAYVEAWRRFADQNRQDKDYYLVIEEINRGNCAQIFGDLFQLLDRTRGGYSSYAVESDTDLQQFLATDETWRLDITLTEDIKNDEGRVIAKAEDIMNGKVLVLPPNLHIWATMNTSDQSLFPIDSAFKRRWDWKYVPISNKKEMDYSVEVDGTLYDWWDFLSKVNTAIGKTTESEDKKLGYFFCKADAKASPSDKENNVISADRFVSKVIFYIWNDVMKDYDPNEVTFEHKEQNEEGKQEYVTYSLMTYKEKGENGEEHDVPILFSDFFQGAGDVNIDTIEQLMLNLQIKIKERK